MSNTALKDILISARQESHRMRHFYLAVEHIFIALLEIKGGLTASILEDHGLTPEYVTDSIRRKIGKGSRHRLWAGIPNTPRTDVILDIAHELAVADGRQNIEERDLLVAILEENSSTSTRVLNALGLEIEEVKHEAQTRTLSRPVQQTFVRIDFGADFEPKSLEKEELFILRRMFHGYAEVRIDRRLTGGYTPALLLIVTPVQVDGREDAAVVVKIGPTDTILDEAQRYERYVKGTLPPLTARLEDKPTAPETSDLAGIKYTLVRGSDGNPHNLRTFAHKWKGADLGTWLDKQLYQGFGTTWWMQNRPYRFEVWREYDWLLPPILTLELFDGDKTPPDIHVLKFPIKRSKLSTLEYGDTVVVENFIVQKVDQDKQTIQLALGQSSDGGYAYQIEIRGINFDYDTYYRGEIVERIIGRIWKTRNEQLKHAVSALHPDFDAEADRIPLTDEKKLPNPIIAYQEIMDQTINGTLSTIHGDLHVGNILIGPNDSALLIDFERTRDGHTAFDWANLEVSLLSDLVMSVAESDWDSVRTVLKQVMIINQTGQLPKSDAISSELHDALQAIVQLRIISQHCLAKPDDWLEYYAALAISALRAVTWETMHLPGRRLMLLVSAMAIYEFQKRQQKPEGDEHTPSPDATDFISNN